MDLGSKMTSEQWCDAVDEEELCGPLSRMAARSRLPVGVDMNDPEVARRIWQCICNFPVTADWPEPPGGAGPDPDPPVEGDFPR